MKIKKTEQIIEKTVYIADDGKEFDDGLDCYSYETKLKKLKLYEDKIRELSVTHMKDEKPPFFGEDENWQYDYYKIESDTDLETIKEYYEILTFGMYFLNHVRVPDILCVCVDCRSNDAYGYSLDVTTKMVVDFYSKLGYSVSIDSREERKE